MCVAVERVEVAAPAGQGGALVLPDVVLDGGRVGDGQDVRCDGRVALRGGAEAVEGVDGLGGRGVRDAVQEAGLVEVRGEERGLPGGDGFLAGLLVRLWVRGERGRTRVRSV